MKRMTTKISHSSNGNGVLASDVTLRSEEIQEILSAPPSWMLKFGITTIFALILGFLFLSWLIKYPDVVTGQVKITTVNPPVQQISNSSGKLILLNKKDNQRVERDETIAIVENLLTEHTSRALQQYIEAVKVGMKIPNAPLPLADTLIVMGELQPGFNTLISAIKAYNRIITDPGFGKNINNLRMQINQYKSMNELNGAQLNLSRQDLENALTRYRINKELYEKNVISKVDFMLEEGKYIMAQQQLNDLGKIKIQNLISFTEYEKQVNDLQSQHDDKLFQTTYSIYEQINNIKNLLQQWEQRYVIKAPFSGTVSYLNSWAISKYVKQGDGLFTVVPDDQDYIGLVVVPSVNFGKIRIGQKVSLRMDSYPYAESGELTGKIKSITLVPGIDNNYRIEISLSNGLLSTNKKQFDYKPDMTGLAQIVTENISVLDRIFYQFRKLIAR
jgi:multidrug resistance efflux pump